MLIPTAEYLEKIALADYKREDYALAVKKSDEVLLHAEGRGIEDHIRKFRPNQPEYMLDFQLANARQVTRSYFRKVQATIAQVLDAEDFNEAWPENNDLAADLQQYEEQGYPYWGDLLSWYRTEGLHAKLTEPNGVYAIALKSWEVPAGQRPEPYVKVFRAEQVIDFVPGKLCVVKLDEPVEGEESTYLLYTQDRIVKVSVVSDGASRKLISKDMVALGATLGHGLGYMPVKQVGGQMFSLRHPGIMESWISGVCPFWDEALVQTFDIQVNSRNHAYMEKVVYTAEDCVDCGGTGKIAAPGLRGDRHKMDTCGTCKGTGHRFNPGAPAYTHIVRPQRQNEQAAPFPHIQYIDKPMAALEFLKQDRLDNIVGGLAALNMEFLAAEPLNTSGRAKEIDRQPLYNYLSTLAYDFVADLQQFDRWIAGMRYVYTDTSLRATVRVIDREDGSQEVELVPNVRAGQFVGEAVPTRMVPRKFNVLSESAIIKEIESARANHVDEMVIAEMELQLAEKKFNGDAEIMPLMRAKYELDPLPGMNSDEKLAAKMNGAVREDDYILSLNIGGFVKRAADEQPGFLELPTIAAKRQALQRYIDEVKAANPSQALAQQAQSMAAAAAA